MSKKIMWNRHYAWTPKVIENKLIWLKPYYIKFVSQWWCDFDTMEDSEIWVLSQMTTNPTEYILFGENNVS